MTLGRFIEHQPERKPDKSESTGNQEGRLPPKTYLQKTISGGATMLPMATPLLKIPMAKARSRTGNHSAITFAAPGQLPASPIPSKNRSEIKLISPRAKACAHAASDQTSIDSVNPRFVPMRS